MLRTRLWMGAVLVALAVGVLVVDQRVMPRVPAPFLFVLVLLLSLVACFELLHLLPAGRRPRPWLCYTAVTALIAVNWLVHLEHVTLLPDRDPWHWLLGVFTAVVLLGFLVEMAHFREPGESLSRLAMLLLVAAYLGLLPSFLAQLRWTEQGTKALALSIFVPKCCDIGAYFTGRLFGRHRMTPVLSPKKTWEGAAGGLATAVASAVGINRIGTTPALPFGVWGEVGFGLTVGLAGMLGDLAESLIKRDCGQKDASHVVPGFGGVLDVVDAVVFAAPVAYCWFM